LGDRTTFIRITVPCTVVGLPKVKVAGDVVYTLNTQSLCTLKSNASKHWF